MSSVDEESDHRVPAGDGTQKVEGDDVVASPTKEQNTPSPVKQPSSPQGKTAAMPPAPAAQPKQMSREEFLRQMGLAPDDLAEGPPPRVSGGSSSALAVVGVAPPVEPALFQRPPGDAPPVLFDEEWLRSTVFTDVSLIHEAAEAYGKNGPSTNDAKRTIMESYKVSRSGGASSSGDTTAQFTERNVSELVTNEDHALAQDYKASLLEEFRKRKKNGEAKAPPPVSPPRQRLTAAE